MNDPLAQVLRSVRLTGAVFLDVRLTAPWCVMSELTAEDCKPFLAKPAQVIFYHMVLQGGFMVSIDGDHLLNVGAGEIVLLPHNDVHVLASEPGLKPVHGSSLVQPGPNGGLARIRHGGPGKESHMICGFLGSEDAYNPVLSTLPRVLKISLRDGTAREWVEASVRFAAEELVAGRLASAGVMSRLAEVLLIEAVRQYATGFGETRSGWLRGLTDPHIGRALALIHNDIRAPWSAETLARAVAMSRSSFMERFTDLVGMPPIRYMTYWRLQAGKLQLREGRLPVGQIAQSVGYRSEEAFSRAFKREFGIPPSRFRETEQQ